jgi:hypothetical protein
MWLHVLAAVRHAAIMLQHAERLPQLAERLPQLAERLPQHAEQGLLAPFCLKIESYTQTFIILNIDPPPPQNYLLLSGAFLIGPCRFANRRGCRSLLDNTRRFYCLFRFPRWGYSSYNNWGTWRLLFCCPCVVQLCNKHTHFVGVVMVCNINKISRTYNQVFSK